MSYRNKTYVAFASEDIHCYRLMEAWRDNEHIDFDFFDAHDLYRARDTSQPVNHPGFHAPSGFCEPASWLASN